MVKIATNKNYSPLIRNDAETQVSPPSKITAKSEKTPQAKFARPSSIWTLFC